MTLTTGIDIQLLYDYIVYFFSELQNFEPRARNYIRNKTSRAWRDSADCVLTKEELICILAY